jgi:hypothetical protein
MEMTFTHSQFNECIRENLRENIRFLIGCKGRKMLMMKVEGK